MKRFLNKQLQKEDDDCSIRITVDEYLDTEETSADEESQYLSLDWKPDVKSGRR